MELFLYYDKTFSGNGMLLVLSYQLLFNDWPIVMTSLVLVSFIDIILLDVLLNFLNWFLFLMLVGTLLDITGCMTVFSKILSLPLNFPVIYIYIYILFLYSIFLCKSIHISGLTALYGVIPVKKILRKML